MSEQLLLEVRGLRVRYPVEEGWIEAVRDVSFELRAGRIHGLVGESGSGKSATALALMGLTRAEGAEVGGEARFRGAGDLDLVGASDAELRELRGARMAMIFQDPLSSLNPYHRVGDQIAEAVRAHREVGRPEACERADRMLAEVGMAGGAAAYPHQLSGGMRQRAMLAMAIANEPRLLIADEPTTALDVISQAQVLDLIQRLGADHRMAVLLITHDLGVVAERAGTVTVMREGRVVESGRTAELFQTPRAPYTRELLESVPRLDRPLVERRRPAGARPAGAGGGQPSEAREAPLLEARGLTYEFPARGSRLGRRGGSKVRAVDGVDLRLEAGATLGLVGESGAGKSTLCRLLIRLLQPTGGSVRLLGADITALHGRRLRAARAPMQMVFQDPHSSLNPRHRIDRIVAGPAEIRGQASGPELRRRTGELLERVGLRAADGRRYPHEFSGGQRQRIALARALAPGPSVILADEPVSSLDVTVQAQVLALMRELQEETGVAYLVVSHDLAVIRQVSDRIAVLRRGRIVETGPAAEICDAPRDPYTRELLAAVPSPVPAAQA